MQNLNELLRDERGATAIEYGLLVGLLAMVMLGVLSSLGFTLAGAFETITAALRG